MSLPPKTGHEFKVIKTLIFNHQNRTRDGQKAKKI